MSFKVLTKQEAAERAKISRTMLDKQIRAGKGPAVTIIGHAVRVRSDELQAWLERVHGAATCASWVHLMYGIAGSLLNPADHRSSCRSRFLGDADTGIGRHWR